MMEAIQIRIMITATSFLSSLLRLLLILSYLILSHLLLILSVTPAEEPLGHQHQQEEGPHWTNLRIMKILTILINMMSNLPLPRNPGPLPVWRPVLGQATPPDHRYQHQMQPDQITAQLSNMRMEGDKNCDDVDEALTQWQWKGWR